MGIATISTVTDRYRDGINQIKQNWATSTAVILRQLKSGSEIPLCMCISSMAGYELILWPVGLSGRVIQ